MHHLQQQLVFVTCALIVVVVTIASVVVGVKAKGHGIQQVLSIQRYDPLSKVLEFCFFFLLLLLLRLGRTHRVVVELETERHTKRKSQLQFGAVFVGRVGCNQSRSFHLSVFLYGSALSPMVLFEWNVSSRTKLVPFQIATSMGHQ